MGVILATLIYTNFQRPGAITNATMVAMPTTSVPIISQTCLSFTPDTSTAIGSGHFGSRTKMIYKDKFTVCK